MANEIERSILFLKKYKYISFLYARDGIAMNSHAQDDILSFDSKSNFILLNLDHELEYVLTIKSPIDSCVSFENGHLSDVDITYPIFEYDHFSSINEYENSPVVKGDSSTHLFEHVLFQVLIILFFLLKRILSR